MPLFRPGKPRLSVVRTTDQTMAAGFQTIVWETVYFDDVAGFDGVSTYTLDRAGLYLLLYRCARRATSTSQSLIMAPAINGVRWHTTRLAASTTAITGGASSDLLELDAGDAITFQAQGHASASWDLYGSHTAASIVRVGPVAWT